MVQVEKPLSGKRILLTRPKNQSKESINEIKSLGGEPILFPTVRIRTLFNKFEFNRFLDHLLNGRVDYVVFLSANGVKSLFSNARKFSSISILAKSLKKSLIVAVGEKTATYLKQFDVAVDVIPVKPNANGIIDEFLSKDISGKMIYVVRTASATNLFRKDLEKMCAIVHEYHVYETVMPKIIPLQYVAEQFLEQKIWAIIFTSPYTVENFLVLMCSLFDKWELISKLNRIVIAAIGSTTEKELKRNGIMVNVIPSKPIFRGLVSSLVEYSYCKKLIRSD
ncbi:MAG: uroporphyrinogen-III synthase [Thaumarchaeota archaeon]|nr:uroporphyrinogen-III synthase [Nitrososphaerota archaeon]